MDASRQTGVSRAQARMMLQRARWAAARFARYDRATTLRIAEAVAEAGFREAQRFAEWAVRETGFGVVEHKRIKNESCSRGLVEHYRDLDMVSPHVDAERRIVEVPRPAGVIVALTPSTNPVSTVYFKILLALLTRNAIVISPHPMARECCTAAAQMMAEAAHAAGAPDGVVQVVEHPSIPLVTSLIEDELTQVILATGGTEVVRAAYRSGNPAMGVGPGNAPVYVDRTADLARAAQRIVDSKAFDNSVLCTNESVLVADDDIADELLRHMRTAGAHVCAPDERDRLRAYLFPEGRLNVAAIGKDATWIAQQAGFRVAPSTRVLVAPFDVVVPEESLTHEKLCPVLGLKRVPHTKRGIDVSRALIRISGAGHSAAIHSRDPRTIMAFTAAVRVLRVVVNTGCSLGASGYETGLAPSMTIGTGYFGRSSLGENLAPHHLVHWTRVAHNLDPSEQMPDLSGIQPWSDDVDLGAAAFSAPSPNGHRDGLDATLRAEIRDLIAEELRQALAGARRG